jgi:ribosomal protein L20A (L18A)
MTKKNKSKSTKRTLFTKKRKGGKKNCTKTCKSMFIKEIHTDKRFKALNRISSFFGAKKKLDNELNSVLDTKDIQNNKVFKECVKDCKKTK